MMDCATFASHRDAFLDGRLTEDEFRLVERHLAECPTCQAAIDHLLAADTHLREQPDPEWTERLSQSVLDQTTAPLARHVWSWQLATAAGWILAIGLGLMLLRPPQSSTPTAQTVGYYQPAPWMKSTLGPRRDIEETPPLVQLLRQLQTRQPPSAGLLEAIARKRQTAFGEERMVLLEAEAACAHLLQPTPQDLQTLFPDLEAQLKALTTPPQRPDA